MSLDHPAPSAVCDFQFIVYYSVYFLRGRSQFIQGFMLVYLRGGCGSTLCSLFALLLVCIYQAGLELALGGAGSLLVSQCNMA
jgi:hypothetical protein